MPKAIAGLIVLAILPAGACAATSTRAQLVALEQAWLHAAQARDIPALRRILARGYTDINYKGVVRDRAAALSAPNVKTKNVMQRLTDETVRVFGCTAIITGRGVLVASSGTAIVAWRFTDVFVRHEGVWRAVSSQETLERSG